MNDYHAALAYLNTFQFHGFRLGLERINDVLEALDNPQKRYPSVHVAGTNGKGSVCATITSILEASGLNCGLYTSPHLYSLCERFRAFGRLISEPELERLIRKIKGLIEDGLELSYFEYTTAIAMNWFAEMEVDVAIFETGLGGRLDATNVIIPQVSVITNIALDHQSFLGETIELIAGEKAGIIKRNVPVVSGVRHEHARPVIRQKAREMCASMWELDRDFSMSKNSRDGFEYTGRSLYLDGINLSMRGRHQAVNSALAVAACERLMESGFPISPECIRTGCGRVTWPCRGEILRGMCTVLLDGAHNADGVTALKRLLQDITGDLRNPAEEHSCLLWACSDEGGDKDFTAMLGMISPHFKEIIITEPPGPRAPVSTESWRNKGIPDNAVLEEDWEKALYRALSGRGPDDFLCIAGSLYLTGRARIRLLKAGFCLSRTD